MAGELFAYPVVVHFGRANCVAVARTVRRSKGDHLVAP